MKDKKLEELESYVFDYQYFLEKSKDAESFKKDIDKTLYRINDMKLKNFDTQEVERQLNVLIEKHAKAEEYLQKLVVQKEEIEHTIDNISQPYKNIFFLKYIKGNSFDEIAKKMHYSSKRIYQLHKEGIKIYIKTAETISVPEISKS